MDRSRREIGFQHFSCDEEKNREQYSDKQTAKYYHSSKPSSPLPRGSSRTQPASIQNMEAGCVLDEFLGRRRPDLVPRYRHVCDTSKHTPTTLGAPRILPRSGACPKQMQKFVRMLTGPAHVAQEPHIVVIPLVLHIGYVVFV